MTQDSLASQQQQRPFDHGVDQTSTHPDPAPTKAADLEMKPLNSNQAR